MGVHQLAAVNAVECLAEMCEKSRQGLTEEALICPKPRRFLAGILGSPPDAAKPALRFCSQIPSFAAGEASCELLEILLSKGGMIGDQGMSNASPYFCGSPPSRAGNPLVNDVHFIRQSSNSGSTSSSSSTRNFAPSPSIHQQKPSYVSLFGVGSPLKNSPFNPSQGAAPSVRIVGFTSSSSDSSTNSSNTNSQGIPALA